MADSSYSDALPPLMRLEGDSIVCGACRRRWRAPSQMSDQNLLYLQDHARDHAPIRRPLPKGSTSSARLQNPADLPLKQCPSCGMWSNTRRCQRCLRDFQLRR